MKDHSDKNRARIAIKIPYVNWLLLLYSTMIAMIGYQIHQSAAWAVVDFFFSLIVPMKWLIFHEVNLTIVRESFAFLLN
jgi:hypothetical protein